MEANPQNENGVLYTTSYLPSTLQSLLGSEWRNEMKSSVRPIFFVLLIFTAFILLLTSVMGRRMAMEVDERRRVLTVRGEALRDALSTGVPINEIELDNLFFNLKDTLHQDINIDRTIVPILVSDGHRWLLLAPEIDEMYDSKVGRVPFSAWLGDGGDLSEFRIIYPNKSWPQRVKRR